MLGSTRWSGYFFSSLYSRSCLQIVLTYCNPRKQPGVDLPEGWCSPRFLGLLLLLLCKSCTVWLHKETHHLFEGKKYTTAYSCSFGFKKPGAFIFWGMHMQEFPTLLIFHMFYVNYGLKHFILWLCDFFQVLFLCFFGTLLYHIEKVGTEYIDSDFRLWGIF